MSNVIQVLAEMASNASLTTEEKLTQMLSASTLTIEQQAAIVSNNVATLTELTQTLPSIKCFAILPAEDDDSEETQDSEDTETSNTTRIAING